MAATPVMSIIGAKVALDALLDLIDVGGAGALTIRTGAPPATSLTADSGTLLATLAMSNPAFNAATSATANGLATATADTITADSSADATNTAGHFRIKSGGGTTILQGTVGTSSADLILNTVSITTGDTVAVTAFAVTLPCGDGAS